MAHLHNAKVHKDNNRIPKKIFNKYEHSFLQPLPKYLQATRWEQRNYVDYLKAAKFSNDRKIAFPASPMKHKQKKLEAAQLCY